MELPQERLLEGKDEIPAPGARLRITLKEGDGTDEVEIEGGQQALVAICSGLASLTPEQLLTPAKSRSPGRIFLGH